MGARLAGGGAADRGSDRRHAFLVPFRAAQGTVRPAPAERADRRGRRQLHEIRRKAARRRNFGIVVGGLLGLLAAGGFVAARHFLKPSKTRVPQVAKAEPQVDRAYTEKKSELRENLAIADSYDPTRGDPIQLQLVPDGASIVLHFRPAEFWKKDSRGEYFRFCIGPAGTALESLIKEMGKLEPADVEECLFCIHLGPIGTPPEYSAVFRTVEEQKMSDVLKKYGGEPVEDAGVKLFLDGEQAYLIRDLKTFAVGPRERAHEMADHIVHSAATSDGMLEMLGNTDRQHHFTAVFQPMDLKNHEEQLVPERLRATVGPVFRQLVDRLGEDTETVSFTLHLGDRFYTDIKLRPHAVSSPARLQKSVRRQIDELPGELYGAVLKMEPKEVGPRQIIGRFPAMVATYAIGTLGGINDRFVQMTTVLPENAAPNLAIGTLLAMDEASRTDFNRTVEPTPTGPTGPGPALSLAQRLQTAVDIDMNRMPLQEAFAYIGQESKIEIDIDGDALKLSGFTKNMPQTYKLGKIPALQAIATIVKPYPKMCIVVDDQKQKVTVTTEPVAADRGLKPYALPAPAAVP